MLLESNYVAFDTETNRGRAFLLSNAVEVFQIKSFWDFVFIVSDWGAKFTWFNLDYDATALFAYLPVRYWKRLHVEKAVEWKGIYLTYFKDKYLEVDWKGKKYQHFDIYSFFQMSLNLAGKKFLGETKREMPKSLLRNLTPEKYFRHKKKVDSYAKQDSYLTQRLTDEIDIALREIGLDNCDLYSPGYIAKRYLARNGVKAGYVPKRYRAFAEQAYHGARIEVFKRGTFSAVDNLDLKSAYPYAISQLPNFCKARYWFSKKIEAKRFILQCQIWMRAEYAYLLPEKRGETTVFPKFDGEKAVITDIEYRYLKRYKLARMKIEKVLNIQCGSGKPYEKTVRFLFKKRKLSGLLGLVFKLILNSWYGDFAETRNDYNPISRIAYIYLEKRNRSGNAKKRFITLQARKCKHARRFWERFCDCKICKDTRKVMRIYKMPAFNGVTKHSGGYYRKVEKDGRMRNIIAAAFVTAEIRVKLFDTLRRFGWENAVACFTDGIYVLRRGNFGKSKANLGEWERGGRKCLTILGSGVYQFGEMVKFRGFRYKKSLRNLLKRFWCKQTIAVPQTFRYSMGEMSRVAIEGDEVKLNEIVDVDKNLDINFDMKRNWRSDFKNCGQALCSQIESEPLTFEQI
jgi:hypothetical protein